MRHAAIYSVGMSIASSNRPKTPSSVNATTLCLNGDFDLRRLSDGGPFRPEIDPLPLVNISRRAAHVPPPSRRVDDRQSADTER